LNFTCKTHTNPSSKKQTFKSIQTKCSMKNLHKNTFLSCGTSLVHLRMQWCSPLNTMNSLNTSGTGRETNMEPPAHWPPAPPKKKTWITHRIQLGYKFDPHSSHSLFFFPIIMMSKFWRVLALKIAKLVTIKLEKKI
jgi:hypothetical protein